MLLTSLQDGLFIGEIPMHELPEGDVSIRIRNDKLYIYVHSQQTVSDGADLDNGSDIQMHPSSESVTFGSAGPPSYFGSIDLPIYVDPSNLQFFMDPDGKSWQVQGRLKGVCEKKSEQGISSVIQIRKMVESDDMNNMTLEQERRKLSSDSNSPRISTSPQKRRKLSGEDRTFTQLMNSLTAESGLPLETGRRSWPNLHK